MIRIKRTKRRKRMEREFYEEKCDFCDTIDKWFRIKDIWFSGIKHNKHYHKRRKGK